VKSLLLKSIVVILFAMMVLVSVARAVPTEEAIEKAAHRNAVVVRLHKEGKIDKALEAAERAYKESTETLGLRQPETATAMHNLAVLLFEEMGELKRAKTLFVRALKIRDNVLGARHRDTIDTRRRLAAVEKILAGVTAAGEHAEEDESPVKVIRNGGPTAPGSRSVKIATKPPARMIKNGGGHTAPIRSTVPVRSPVLVEPRPVKVKVLNTKTPVPPARAKGGSVKIMKNGDAGTLPPTVRNNDVVITETRHFPMTAAGEAVGDEIMPASFPDIDPDLEFDEYAVKLGVDEVMKMPGPVGVMRLWIGALEYAPEFSEGMSEAVGSLPKVGETAKVRAVAPDFEVEPIDSICIKLHPTGTDAVFVLRPKKKGEFKVSAVVELYESGDCTGVAIPKAVETLRVRVVVDTGEVVGEHAGELWNIFWEKFLDFWGAIVALFFGLILFLLRGKLKKIFGFSGDKD